MPVYSQGELFKLAADRQIDAVFSAEAARRNRLVAGNAVLDQDADARQRRCLFIENARSALHAAFPKRTEFV